MSNDISHFVKTKKTRNIIIVTCITRLYLTTEDVPLSTVRWLTILPKGINHKGSFGKRVIYE